MMSFSIRHPPKPSPASAGLFFGLPLVREWPNLRSLEPARALAGVKHRQKQQFHVSVRCRAHSFGVRSMIFAVVSMRTVCLTGYMCRTFRGTSGASVRFPPEEPQLIRNELSMRAPRPPLRQAHQGKHAGGVLVSRREEIQS